jgi:hypothetical protein
MVIRCHAGAAGNEPSLRPPSPENGNILKEPPETFNDLGP